MSVAPNASIDMVIRAGLIADGLGGPLFEADIGIQDHQIVQVGPIIAKGKTEINAKGLLVTPGFVDVHTHYDGQAVWDSSFAPSSWHGVTTVVMGNCGVGFAPVHKHDQQQLIELMEGIEDIPGVALNEGLDWAWESFPQYLDALERRKHDIDFCAQLPHAALRLYVMGERAMRLEMATANDIAQMRGLTTEAIKAGAIGITTSRSINHRTSKGDPTFSLLAAEDELMGLAMGLADANAGVMQIICDFEENLEQEFEIMRQLVKKSGRPLSFSLMQKHNRKDGWFYLLEKTAQANAEGLPITAQVAPRGIGVLLSLQGSRNIFTECPSYQAITSLDMDKRIKEMRKPAIKARLLKEIMQFSHTRLGRRLTEFSNMFLLEDPPNYNPGFHKSIASLALQQGISPLELAYEQMLKDNGKNTLYSPFANYAQGDLNVCEQMIADPHTVIGLGDGGAHVALVSDANFSSFLMTHWALQEKAFDIGFLIKKQTSDTAKLAGLNDRGVIAPGMKADINIIDLKRLSIGTPEMVFDLPAGGRRFLQGANGYVATIVSGQAIYLEGQATGHLPGRLVRGSQAPVHP